MILSKQEAKEWRRALKMQLRREDFWEYCIYMDPEFFAARPFLKEVADIMTWIKDEYKAGRSHVIGVSLPPRSGKSYIGSLFAAWWLGNFPQHAVMRNTCVAKLYQLFSYAVRKFIKSDKYRALFPWVVLQPDKQNIDGWNLITAKLVSYFGAGVGGNIIGQGANLAMSDDLYNGMSDALNPNVREKVAIWKESDHDSRMETGCPEIFLGTRWMKNDEIGKAIDTGHIEKMISIPALVDVVRDEKGRILSGRSFCENVRTTAEYMKTMRKTDRQIFEAEYMQTPIEIGGYLFPASELNYFKPSDLQTESGDWIAPDYKLLVVDPADKGGDALSAPDCLLYGNRIFVTRALFNQDGTDITIPRLIEQICMMKYSRTDIEGQAAWILFGKQIREKVWARPSGESADIAILNATTHKGTRILAQSAFIRVFFVFLEKEYWDAEYEAFMKCLTEYLRDGGNNQSDDAPDSLVMAAEHFQKILPELW